MTNTDGPEDINDRRVTVKSRVVTGSIVEMHEIQHKGPPSSSPIEINMSSSEDENESEARDHISDLDKTLQNQGMSSRKRFDTQFVVNPAAAASVQKNDQNIIDMSIDSKDA